MIKLPFLVMVVSMSTFAISQGLTSPDYMTDPKQITARPDADVEQGEESLSLQRLYMTRLVGDTAWSPDGKSIVFVSNITGRNNLWLVPADGGWPTQLTVSDQRQTHPTWSPDGRWIAYQSDYEGDEQWEIFFVSPKTGQVVNVTKTREVAEENPTWSPDGKFIVYTQEEAMGTNSNIFIAEVATGKSTLLTPHEGERLYSASDFSSDGKTV